MCLNLSLLSLGKIIFHLLLVSCGSVSLVRDRFYFAEDIMNKGGETILFD